MQIENYPPDNPKFGLIVLLSGVAILVIFAIVLLLFRWDGTHLVPRHVSNKAADVIMPFQELRLANVYLPPV